MKLQRLQNRGLKLAMNKVRLYNTEQLHAEAKIATWEKRTGIALCRLIFKYKYNEDYISSGRETRAHDGPVFQIDTPKTGWFTRSAAYMSRKIWNALPAHIRLIDNLDVFKRAVKTHFRITGYGAGDEGAVAPSPIET